MATSKSKTAAIAQPPDTDLSVQQLLTENTQLRGQVAQLTDLNDRLAGKLFILRSGVSALSDKIKKVK